MSFPSGLLNLVRISQKPHLTKPLSDGSRDLLVELAVIAEFKPTPMVLIEGPSGKAYNSFSLHIDVQGRTREIDPHPGVLRELLSSEQPELKSLHGDLYQLTAEGIERARLETSPKFIRWCRRNQIGARAGFVVGMVLIILLALLLVLLVSSFLR